MGDTLLPIVDKMDPTRTEGYNYRMFTAVELISSSIPRMCDTLAHSILHFLVANPPIETWSSCPAEVTIESAEAGLTSTLLSDSRLAVVSE